VSDEQSRQDLMALTAGVVGAFVGNHKVTAADLPGLIQSVHAALSTAGMSPAVEEASPTVKATPAQIRKSITPDALISFEDGKPYKTLKRHLGTFGLTLEQYRAKWGLPSDYPTVAPTYSEARSAMAKALGLGHGGRKPKGKARKG
jgi:predicted transcriptional regulator